MGSEMCIRDRTNLSKASLEQVTAREANFAGADLSESHCLMANFTDAILLDAEFDFANLEAVVFRRSDLTNVSFEGALLLDTDFQDSNWWRAVGINQELLADFQERFAPTENAPQAFRDDFDAWLQDE